MPYAIEFTKPVQVADPDIYINECCWGGDVVTKQLLPLVTGEYDDIQHEQEDWGWFIWFRKDRIALAIDVTCDDPEQGAFRIHLTSRQKRWLLPARIVDTPRTRHPERRLPPRTRILDRRPLHRHARG
jgi:hypothetical protein